MLTSLVFRGGRFGSWKTGPPHGSPGRVLLSAFGVPTAAVPADAAGHGAARALPLPFLLLRSWK